MRSISFSCGRLTSRLALGSWLTSASPVAASAEFPDKPVRIVVPFPAGGSNDVIARLVGAKLGELWGQTVMIENRGGGGGNIGADAVARVGARWLHAAAHGAGAARRSTSRSMPNCRSIRRKDFTPVALIASVPIVLAVHPDVKATTGRRTDRARQGVARHN